MTSKLLLKRLAHFILFLIYFYNLSIIIIRRIYNFKQYNPPEESDTTKMPYLFLTYWTIFFHSVYYLFSSLNFQPNVTRVIFKIMYPLGCFVPIIFWTVYLIDRELIYPEYNDIFISQLSNHVMHSLTVVTYLLSIILDSNSSWDWPVEANPRRLSNAGQRKRLESIIEPEDASYVENSNLSNLAQFSLIRELTPAYIFIFVYFNFCVVYNKIFNVWPYKFFDILWNMEYWTGYFGLAIFAFLGMSWPILLTEKFYCYRRKCQLDSSTRRRRSD